MVNEEHYSPLPPPGPGEVFDNTKTKRIRVTETGRPRSQHKGLVQLNVKVRGKTKTRFEAVYEVTKAAVPDLTKGEFFELMLTAFEAKASGVDMAKVAEAMQHEPVPPPKDKAAGRDRALVVFATPALSRALEKRSTTKGWTLSETVEHVCTMAKRAEGLAAELERPCGHCGKARRK